MVIYSDHFLITIFFSQKKITTFFPTFFCCYSWLILNVLFLTPQFLSGPGRIAVFSTPQKFRRNSEVLNLMNKQFSNNHFFYFAPHSTHSHHSINHITYTIHDHHSHHLQSSLTSQITHSHHSITHITHITHTTHDHHSHRSHHRSLTVITDHSHHTSLTSHLTHKVVIHIARIH